MAGKRLVAGAGLIGLHALLHATLIALPAYAWLQSPSLLATLGLAAAIALAILMPWRLWPSLALVLAGHTGETGTDRSVRSHLDRALRGARVLTQTHDVFLTRAVPGLCIHSLLLLLPIAVLWAPAGAWLPRAIGALVALALAGLGYRYLLTSGEALWQRRSAPPEVGDPIAAADAPIPANALLRSAAMRDALRAGAVDRALAILAAGVDPTVPALPDEIDQRDALTIAATLNDSRPLRAMIAAGADVNHRCHDVTPLLAATRDSYYGRAETVLTLLANGADLRALDNAGQTALHHAALSAEPSVAAILLDAGAPIDAIDTEGHTPLSRACTVANASVIALLIERRASIDAGSIPVLSAAAGGPIDDTDVIARLLRAKAAVDAVDGDGRTALHHAVMAGHAAIAGALIAAGAQPNAPDNDGRTPFHLACIHFDADAPIVAMLRSAGADAGAPDATGVTPADLLAEGRRVPGIEQDTIAPEEDIDTLLAAGRQAAVQTWLRRASPRQRADMAIAAAKQGMARSIADALSTPLSGDAVSSDGRPLVDAAIECWPASASLLAALPGAGVSIAGGARLAQLLAAPGGDNEAKETIALAWLDAGADPFAGSGDDGNVLRQAVVLGMERLVLRLLERGIDPSLGDRNGLTALHIALRHADEMALRLVLCLLRFGADPEAATCSGETPLGLALDTDRARLVDWLRWRNWRMPRRKLAPHDLVAAAQAGDTTAVRRLLALGLPIDSRDHQGCTALIHAAGSGDRALLDELITRGADIAAAATSGSTALAAALMRGHIDIVERLLEQGAKVDQRFANEATGLIVAAACGSLSGIDTLIVAGADLHAVDAAGNTALHAAAGHAFGSADGVVARALLLNLISAGADIDAVNGAGLTPLHVACGAAAATRANSVGIDAALDVLLSRTHRVGDIDGGGCAPLHYAAAHGQLGAVRRLLARGGDPMRRDHGGWRAEDYAQRYGYTEVAQALRPSEPPLSAALPLRPG